MAFSVEIDPDSGFCGGVIRAIGSAEKFLEASGGGCLYSLGAIVHNEEELERLGREGLVTIDKEAFLKMKGAAGETLLIRAHGEPPQTYVEAKELGFNVIDCTCPVVLKLQASIREAYARLKPAGGQLVIFGKIGHAEVLGLVGQVGGDALVVEDISMLERAVEDGRFRTDAPTEVFSQTTKSPAGFDEICKRLAALLPIGKLVVHNTICRQVAMRHEKLSQFALSHDVILFVSGKSSSNGKVLCDLCKSLNIRTYHIGSEREVKKEWFKNVDRVGVCGATSTPKWLLDRVAAYVAGL